MCCSYQIIPSIFEINNFYNKKNELVLETKTVINPKLKYYD